MTPEEIVEALTKSKRLGTHELGGDKPTLVVLRDAGVIREDGTITTGKRGRPPIAWVLVDGSKASDVDISEPTKRGTPEHRAKMDEGRRKAKEARDKEQVQARKVELAQLKKALPGYEKKYETSLKTARKAKTEDELKSTYDISDQMQNAVINTSRRIRVLEAA